MLREAGFGGQEMRGAKMVTAEMLAQAHPRRRYRVVMAGVRER